ncbi:MAG: hypothetical protein ABF785_10120 [Acetobacter papayae]
MKIGMVQTLSARPQLAKSPLVHGRGSHPVAWLYVDFPEEDPCQISLVA